MIITGFSKPINRIPIVGYIYSWGIRLLENTSYSHVYIRFYSEKYKRWLVYEASGTTVHFVEFSRFLTHCEIVKEFNINCTEDTKTKVVTKAIDYANSPYGIKQVLGILLVKIARFFGKDIDNPFSDGKATWVCSEIVSELLKELGINLGIKEDNITPKDIFKYLESLY